MRGKRVVCLLALVVLLGMTACSNSSDTQTSETPKNVSGSFQASEKLDPEYACTIDVIGTWGNFEALDQAAQEFQKFYPNIEVVYSPLDDVGTDTQNRMASGKGIDIYMYNWFDTGDNAKAYLWENALDLSKIGLNMDALDADFVNTGYVDGKLCMLPVYRRIYGFMVNEDLLKAHGLNVPSTYEEFLSCCEALKKEGIYPVLYQGNENLISTYNQHIAAQTIKDKDRDQIMKDALKGTDRGGYVEETLQMIEELSKKGYVHPDSNQLADGYEALILRFFEGDIPFVPYNTEQFSGTRKREAKSEHFTNELFSYQFLPFPGTEGYESVFEQLGTMYMGIYKGIPEEKQPYVCELLRYLLSDEGSRILGQVKNMPTINKHTGFQDFPYLQGLTDQQIFVVGENGFSLAYSELLRETQVEYEEGLAAEDYLNRSIAYIKAKKEK